MEPEVMRADARMRVLTIMVLVVATMACGAGVVAFQHWLGQRAAALPTAMLVAQLRAWVGIASTGIALCLLLLAAHAARQARRVAQARRWPLPDARPLRDTPVRRDAAALRLANWFRLGAVLGMILALASAVVSLQLLLLAA